MRGFLVGLIIVAVALAGPVTAAEAPAGQLVEKGALTYGVAATFAPFEFQKDSKLAGFDIDLITAIAKKLALKPVAMNMDFTGLIPALQGGRLDLINSAMYINPKRAEQVDFVPYLKIGDAVIVQKGNPATITGRNNSLCGKSIAVTLGAIEETYAREDAKRCEDAKLPPVNVLTLPTAQDAALSLRQGRADVFYDSTPGAVELMANVPDTYETTGPEFESNTKLGMAVRKGDTTMKAALEAALKEVVGDGAYKKLIETWKFPSSVALFN
jgi:polar amino acid transport system substrate-binding protein